MNINKSKIEINIACNNSNGDFADEIVKITINDDILEMDSFNALPCKFDDNKLIFDIDIDLYNHHLEIPVKLKGACVGNVFWNVFEMHLSEATKFINFLWEIGWTVFLAESSLYEAMLSGEISEQDLELAFEE